MFYLCLLWLSKRQFVQGVEAHGTSRGWVIDRGARVNYQVIAGDRVRVGMNVVLLSLPTFVGLPGELHTDSSTSFDAPQCMDACLDVSHSRNVESTTP